MFWGLSHWPTQMYVVYVVLEYMNNRCLKTCSSLCIKPNLYAANAARCRHYKQRYGTARCSTQTGIWLIYRHDLKCRFWWIQYCTCIAQRIERVAMCIKLHLLLLLDSVLCIAKPWMLCICYCTNSIKLHRLLLLDSGLCISQAMDALHLLLYQFHQTPPPAAFVGFRTVYKPSHGCFAFATVPIPSNSTPGCFCWIQD